MVTGGHKPISGNQIFEVVYELGKSLGQLKFQVFAGATCSNHTPKHNYGRILKSKMHSREAGIPELVENADIVFLIGGGTCHGLRMNFSFYKSTRINTPVHSRF